MSEKKTVRRSIAITLAIAAILLAAGIGGVMAYYTMTINNKDETYNNYVSNYSHSNYDFDALNSTHNFLLSEYGETLSRLSNYIINYHFSDSEYDALQTQVNDLTIIVNLGRSTVWVNSETISQPASSFSVWTFSPNYAGYVSVWVQTSTVSGTHVKAIYSSHGVDFNQEIVVNAGNTANFPILPTSSLQIEVGNGNLVNGATETVTITYHY